MLASVHRTLMSTKESAKPTGKGTVNTPASDGDVKTQKSVPAGFFDDALDDAKARDVDVKAIAAKQEEEDWATFQQFMAETEKKEREDEQEQEKEDVERSAVQDLDNMQYVDRYRMLLERAAALDSSSSNKRKQSKDTQEEFDDEDDITSIVQQHVLKKAKRKREE